MPTDLANVTFASFADRQDGNFKAAVATASAQIAAAIRRLPPGRHDVIPSGIRDISESHGKDELLRSATQAKFVAMTYATLGRALTSHDGIGTLPHLQRAQVGVYALPILYTAHPTVTHADAIEREWTEGVLGVLKSLNNRFQCPQIQHLDLVILSVEPTFTASLLTYPNGDSEESRVRYTPVVAGIPPASLPTLHLTSQRDSVSPLFDQFKDMVDALDRERSPMRFPVRRGTTYVRQSLDDFVKRLRLLCSRHSLQSKDRIFRVLLKSPAGQTIQGSLIDEHSLAQHYDRCLSRNSAVADFRVEFDFETSTATVGTGSTMGAGLQEVRGGHIVGSFVLMTAIVEKRPSVILARYTKGRWTHDVPGGKVSIVDKSLAETAEREIFEELGVVIDGSRLSAPLAFKYDSKSARDSIPVIAVYHHYALNRRETDYLLKASGANTKGYSLAAYPLTELIHDQRSSGTVANDSVCHASSWILEELLRAGRLEGG